MSIPDDVLEELVELEKEFREGEITAKGYEKRRQKVLEPYGGESALINQALRKPANSASSGGGGGGAGGGGSRSAAAASTPINISAGTNGRGSFRNSSSSSSSSPSSSAASSPSASSPAPGTGYKNKTFNPSHLAGSPALNAPSPLSKPMPSLLDDSGGADGSSPPSSPKSSRPPPVLEKRGSVKTLTLGQSLALNNAVGHQALSYAALAKPPAAGPSAPSTPNSNYVNIDTITSSSANRPSNIPGTTPAATMSAKKEPGYLSRNEIAAIANAVGGNANRSDPSYISRSEIAALTARNNSSSSSSAAASTPPPTGPIDGNPPVAPPLPPSATKPAAEPGYISRSEIANLTKQAQQPPPAPPAASTPSRNEPGYLSRNDIAAIAARNNAAAAAGAAASSQRPASSNSSNYVNIDTINQRSQPSATTTTSAAAAGAASSSSSSSSRGDIAAALAARNAGAAAASSAASTPNRGSGISGPGGAQLTNQGSRGLLNVPGASPAGPVAGSRNELLETAAMRRRSSFLPNVDERMTGDDDDEAPAAPVNGGFSSRIQQLVSALKAPNQAPKQKFFAKTKEVRRDPTAPKPSGELLLPVEGAHENLPSDPQRLNDVSATNTLAEVLVWRSTLQAKKVAMSQFDIKGKLAQKITFAGLLDRAQRVSDLLLNRLQCTVGNRVALIFRREDAIDLAAALFGCFHCGVVAIPLVLPKSVEDATATQAAFLLNSCGVKHVLTNEALRKTLPKDSSGRLAKYKGWPAVEWVPVDGLPKVPPKKVREPFRLPPAAPAFIECVTTTTGEVKPVVVTHKSLLYHLLALMKASQYTSQNVAISVLDPFYGIGLHHGPLMSVFACMHVIFLPFATFTETPMHLWKAVTKFKVNIILCSYPALAFSASRITDKERKTIKLESLKQILIDTERTSPDLSKKFCDRFQVNHGIIATTFFTPESLTVACRSPASPPLLLHLDLKMLGFEVVRILPPDTKGAVFVQDSGFVLPHSRVVVCTLENEPKLCLTDQVGEICITGATTAVSYFGLEGKTAKTFRLRPQRPSGQPIDNEEYVRTGWLGFIYQGRVFVTGSASGLIASSAGSAQVNPEDIKKIVLSVTPSAVHGDKIAVFSVDILEEERIVLAFETSRSVNEQLSAWTRTVCEQVEAASGSSIYSVCFCKVGSLPMGAGGVVDAFNCKKLFVSGTLNPIHVIMNMTGVTNLPKAGPRAHEAARMMADAITGTQLSDALGKEDHRSLAVDDTTLTSLDNFKTIGELLRWRAMETPNSPLFTMMDESGGKEAKVMDCAKFHKKVLSIAHYLVDKLQINSGDSLGVLLPQTPEFAATIFACMYIGAVAVPLRPPVQGNLRYSVPTLRRIVHMSQARAIVSNSALIKLLRSKEAGLDKVSNFPPIYSIDDAPKAKEELPQYYKPPTTELLAVIEFNVSSTGLLAGVRISHETIMSHCRSQKVFHQYHSSSRVFCSVDPFSGIGLIYWTFLNVYNGHLNIGLPTTEVVKNPALFLAGISNFRAKYALTSFPVIQQCVDELTAKSSADRLKGLDLSCLVRLMFDAQERPRANLQQLFSAAFTSIGLSASAIDNSFGCDVNALISMRPPNSKEVTAAYLDLNSLRQDRVELVERGSPNSVCIYSSGRLLPRNRIAIVNPESTRLCTQKTVGEIWVNSVQNNNKGYFGLDVSVNDTISQETFSVKIQNNNEIFARTGFFGFLWESEVFVVGDMDETFMINGFRHYPWDIEQSVEKSSKKISADGSGVFLASDLLVVVVETQEAAEIVNMIPIITNSVLGEHGIIVHVIAFVKPGTIPKNGRGQKQRIRLRDGFMKNLFDPIHVAYNVIDQ